MDKAAEAQRAADIAANNEKAKAVQEEKRRHPRKKGGLDPAKAAASQFTGKIKIENTKNVLYTLAGCCQPKVGDVIIGYSSKNKGIMIHRADCLTFLRIPNIENRKVEVEWEERDKNTEKN